MSCHALDVDDAIKYGVDAAILLYNLKHWLVVNRANHRNVHDGHYWSYNKASAYAEIFPYWTANKIQKTLKKLENEGVVISGSYSENKYDRTKWYSMPEFCINPNGCNESAKRLNDNSQKAYSSLSNINTDINTNITTDNYSPNNRFYIGRLNQEDFNNCYKACDELTMYSGVFAGCLSIEEWETCEEAMRSVDEFNHIDYFEWWVGKYAKSFTKKPSLPNMLCDVNGISFDRFYETVFLNEFE